MKKYKDQLIKALSRKFNVYDYIQQKAELQKVNGQELRSEMNLNALLIYLQKKLTEVLNFWDPPKIEIPENISKTKKKKLKKKQQDLENEIFIYPEYIDALRRSIETITKIQNKLHTTQIDRVAISKTKEYLKSSLASYVVGKTHVETGKVVRNLNHIKTLSRKVRNQKLDKEVLPAAITEGSRMLFLALNAIFSEFKHTIYRLKIEQEMYDLFEDIMLYNKPLQEIIGG